MKYNCVLTKQPERYDKRWWGWGYEEQFYSFDYELHTATHIFALYLGLL